MDSRQVNQPMAVSSEEAYLLSIMHSVWKHRCISVIIGLKIPDLLCNSDKPSISIEDIAIKSGCKTSAQLYEVMKVLARWDIGKELENKHFTKNESMELLRQDKGPSLGHFFGYFASDEHFKALSCLGACVKQGKPAFVLEHGMSHFTYMNNFETKYEEGKMFEGVSEYKIGSDERRKELADEYAKAMTYMTNLESLANHILDNSGSKTVYNVFPWSTCNKLVDIGGSLGTFLASILKLPGCEHIKGYVVDYSNVVEEAKTKIQELGINDTRIQFIAHDFTKPFPSDLDLQADTLMFKRTLGMFIQNKSLTRKVLSNCCSLFPPGGGRLLIIDNLDLDDKDPRIEINALEYGTHMIHRLSTTATPGYRKSEWMDSLQEIGSGLGYRVEKIIDHLCGPTALIELSWSPNNECL